MVRPRVVANGFKNLCLAAVVIASLSYATSSLGEGRAATSGSRSEAVGKSMEDDCFSPQGIAARELCFSRKSDGEIDECERMQLFSCRPYRDMHRLNVELEKLQRDALLDAKRRFAPYTGSNPSYLDDLADYLDRSARTWAESRDADCLLEPFAQGMSRRDAANLTEACRAERTRERVRYMTELFASGGKSH